MKDNKTVSNEPHELKAVADKYHIPVSQVMEAKEQTRSNDRDVIESYIEKQLSEGCDDGYNGQADGE